MHLGEFRECHEGEVDGVVVIFQVEDFGEAGAGEGLFAPGAIFVL